MAEPKPSERFSSLMTALDAQTDMTAIFKLAVSDEFKVEASQLPPAELAALRDHYNARRAVLDNKVRLDTFNGQIVYVVGVETWHSDKSFSGNGDGVTLHVRREADMPKLYKCLTSSLPTVQFVKSLSGTLPTEDAPVRAIFTLVPVSDAKRAADGQKKWSVKRLPTPNARTTDAGTPF